MDLQMARVPDVGFVLYRGTINGSRFFFRARGTGWIFMAYETVGSFPRRSLTRKGTYGTGSSDASNMPADEAECIIRRFAREYAAHLGEMQ